MLESEKYGYVSLTTSVDLTFVILKNWHFGKKKQFSV